MAVPMHFRKTALRAHGRLERDRRLALVVGTFVLVAGAAMTAAILSLTAERGVFVTHYNGGIGPSEAGVMKSVRYVAIVAVGGMANIWGALIIGIVLNFLSLRGIFGSYDDAVFGVILIVIMLFAPEGILNVNPWQKIKSLFALFVAHNKEESAEN